MPNTIIRQVLGPFRGNDIGTALRTLRPILYSLDAFLHFELFLVVRLVSIDTTQKSVKERSSPFPKNFRIWAPQCL
jgi:hypothetical protein